MGQHAVRSARRVSRPNARRTSDPPTRPARRPLAIPATSVPSERLFSKAGDVISKKCNRLAPSKADRIVFLMDNLK